MLNKSQVEHLMLYWLFGIGIIRILFQRFLMKELKGLMYSRRKFIHKISMATMAIGSASMLPYCEGPTANETGQRVEIR
jgi:hypothetical protein